jgi:polysaccharide biosynthesis protein PslG
MFRLSKRWGARRTPVVVAVAASLAAGIVASTCLPASATNVRVRHSLFGMHDSTGISSSFHQIHEGAVRLWDVGVQWQQVETSRGHYNWTRMDQLVAQAQAARAEVTMVVAFTPHFYAARPTDPPRNIDRYKAFVRALMKRYRSFDGRRGIAAYQVWNEANIATYWTGTLPQLARLTRAMDQVRDHVDPQAKVVAPAMVTRLEYQLVGLSRFYHQRVGGVPVWRYLDAVALSMYPLASYGRRAGVPEDSIRQLNAVRHRLRGDGVPRSKPIWNTEVNYGLQSGSLGGTPARRISESRQAANVVRTYLLNAAAGVKRVFWYRFDMRRQPGGGQIANTLLTPLDDPERLTGAGGAYLRAQRWMHGTLLGPRHGRPCRADRHGTHTCVVRDTAGRRYIYWNPFHGATVRLPKGVHHLQGVLGATSTVTPRSTLSVSYKPVMVSR